MKSFIETLVQGAVIILVGAIVCSNKFVAFLSICVVLVCYSYCTCAVV